MQADALATPREQVQSGLRILLVEDEFLVAVVVEEALRELRCEVVGPVAAVDEAVAMARHEPLDGAILDINLMGRLVYPAADILQERGVPFVFTTGYALGDLPPQYRAVPRIPKPAQLTHLRDAVTAFARVRAG